MKFFTILSLLSLLSLSLALPSRVAIDAHRLAQFDINEQHFGSQTSVLNFKLASVDDILAINEDSRIKGNRYVAFAKIQQLTEEIVNELVDIQGVGGIIVIVPKNADEITAEERNHIYSIEHYFMSRAFDASIYFIYDEKDIQPVFESINKTGSIHSSRYTVSAPFKNNKKTLPVEQLHSIQSIVYGSSEHSDSLPTILISANYDSFAIAPSMSTGVTDNASGSVALLELARLFSRFSANTGKHGAYNLVFLLTDGAIYDNEGLREYIMNKPSSFFDNLFFALSLDRLGLHQELTLQISRPAKTEELSRLYSTIESVAKQLEIPLTIEYQSVNLQNEHRTFMHERFALRRIPSGTLTSVTKEEQQLQGQAFMRGSFLDTNINMDAYLASIRLVAESLTRFMIHLDHMGSIYEGALALNTESINHWMETFKTTPRCTPFISKDHILVQSMNHYLSQYTDETTILSTSMEGQEIYSFYADHSGEIVFSKTQSPFIDIYILVGLVAGLVFFYGFVIYITRGMSALKQETNQLYDSVFGKEKNE